MQRFTKAIAVIILVTVALSVGCSNSNSGDTHDCVDLGLPSGTLWATCNVGAESPDGFGNYYAWGDTRTKETYNWVTYRHSKGKATRLTKYCNKSDYGNNGFIDNLTTLQSRDDPAASWGSGWQTPSKTQWDELLANTTNQETTQNGKYGRLFISKMNGQTLFLPAAGYRWGSELDGARSYGSYWSSSLSTDGPNGAWGLDFIKSGSCEMHNYTRYFGRSVRAVRSAAQD